jgi:hypothetical protein
LLGTSIKRRNPTEGCSNNNSIAVLEKDGIIYHSIKLVFIDTKYKINEKKSHGINSCTDLHNASFVKGFSRNKSAPLFNATSFDVDKAEIMMTFVEG